MSPSNLGTWLKSVLQRAAWAPFSVFVFHVVAAKAFGAYERFPPLDIPMHFVGGLVIAYFVHVASVRGSQCGVLGPFNVVTHVVLVFCATCSTTVFWEFAEFLNDAWFDGQSQAGLTDTMKDMLLGTLGGSTFLLMKLISRRRFEPPAQA